MLISRYVVALFTCPTQGALWGSHNVGALDIHFNKAAEVADLYYNTLPLSVFMFSTSFCSSCLCSPEAFCFLKADYFVVNIMVLTPKTVLRPSLLTTGCFLPLFSQQTGKLFGFFMHKDLVFCRQITGEFEELLLSLIDGLILWLVLL